MKENKYEHNFEKKRYIHLRPGTAIYVIEKFHKVRKII